MSFYGRGEYEEEDGSYSRRRINGGHPPPSNDNPTSTHTNRMNSSSSRGRDLYELSSSEHAAHRGRQSRPRSRSPERYYRDEEILPSRRGYRTNINNYDQYSNEEKGYHRRSSSMTEDRYYRSEPSLRQPSESSYFRQSSSSRIEDDTPTYYRDHSSATSRGEDHYEDNRRNFSRSSEPRDRGRSHTSTGNGYDRRTYSSSIESRFIYPAPSSSSMDYSRSNYPQTPQNGGGGNSSWAYQEPTRPTSSTSSYPRRKEDASLPASFAVRKEGPTPGPKKKPFVQIDPNPRAAITNIIPADITRNFHFYLYGVSCTSKTKNMDGTNAIHGKLFYHGIETLLREKMAYTQTQIDDTLRVVFFEGSAVLSSRKIPGIEKDDLPFLVYQDVNDGDTCTITSFECFRAPSCLQNSLPIDESNIIGADFRCAKCTTAFATQDALLSHCKSLGHSPVFAPELVESSSGSDGHDVTVRVTTVRPAMLEVFLAFCNVALQRALSERLARWGKDFIDSTSFTTPSNRFGKSLGVRVFRAFRCEFTMGKVADKDTLILSIDINAKVIRTTSVLESIYSGRDPRTTRLDDTTVADVRKRWINEQVICLYDKKTYTVVDILFDRSPATMPIEGLNMSHAEYFEKKKGIVLEYPNVMPLLQVYGRNKTTIYFPAELVCGNQFDMELKAQLPVITSFMPKERNDAIDEMKRYLKAGAQKSKNLSGLLPAIGVVLAEDRVNVLVDVLPLPNILLAGISVPQSRGSNWAPVASKATFDVQPGNATMLNVVLVYNKRLRNYLAVYKKLVSVVNRHVSSFRLSDFPYATIEAGDLQHHWEAVEQFFRSERNLPPNIFIVDFNQPPRGSETDPAYPVIKEFLARFGFLSQFVNFNCSSHTDQDRRSNLILGAVGRQILNKCGARIWWVEIPRSIPLPAVIVGVDVFHAPRRFDPRLSKYFAKESVAAVVVQLLRRFDKHDQPVYEVFSKTERRKAGGEYEVGNLLEDTVTEALQRFTVSPQCCICWRDGVGDSSITHVKNGEIPALRKGLMNGGKHMIPTAYVVCQKRISTKFISVNGHDGMPPGALIQDVGSPIYQTFYIHGPSPPISTPRSIRYLVVEKDDGLQDASLPQLAWALSHDYPNWSGPIKVPSVVQLAHKLAEMAGNFAECGEEINYSSAFPNTLHFL